jgi:hypothetical protein
MKASVTVLAVVSLLVGASHLRASGPLGIYGIVERVVFEPNETAPERIQVWGAFAYVDGAAGEGLTVSVAKRGYLYLRLDPSQADAIKREWADLKSVAGTGQAIGFGTWAYIGRFSSLQTDARNSPAYILEHNPQNERTDLRVRAASEVPASPALYQTDAGIVKLSATGNHAAIVNQLKDALKR